MKLVIIVAVAENRVIGNNGKIPWRIPEDMAHFKQLTIPHPVVMGRVTYESIPEKFRPLLHRKNIVLSERRDFDPKNNEVIVCKSISEALEKAGSYDTEAHIIGGQKIYEKTIDLANRLEITEVHKSYKGDAFFPEFDRQRWKEVARSDCGEYSFVSYKRKY